MSPEIATVRERLRHVYWIGGGSGAGKSTIARRIAAEHGLHLYATDDVMTDHARRSTPEERPLLDKFIAMDMDERWVNRPPSAMFETFPWFRGEAFKLIIDDLLSLPTSTCVIVEGFRLLPHLVQPLLSVPGRAVWLLPTPEFRKAAIDRRGGSAGGFFAKTSDPEKALQNLMERDRMFTDHLRNQTEHFELPGIEVDTTMTEQDSINRVTQIFGL